tara:strand:+ start:40306 stop:40569 length:264 start_codon:yes stop_codon:yes gene_type:complete
MTTRQTLFKSKGRIFYSFFSQKEKGVVLIDGFFLNRAKISATLCCYGNAPIAGEAAPQWCTQSILARGWRQILNKINMVIYWHISGI